MKDTKIIVSERFKSLLSSLKLTVPDLAKQLGYERYDKLYNIYNAKYLPSFEILHDITNMFVDVNANWFLTGEGPMFKSEKSYEAQDDSFMMIAEPHAECHTSESIIYRMYTDEREERCRVQKEKEELIRKVTVLEEQLKKDESSVLTAKAVSSGKSPVRKANATSANARSNE